MAQVINHVENDEYGQGEYHPHHLSGHPIGNGPDGYRANRQEKPGFGVIPCHPLNLLPHTPKVKG